MTGVTPRHQVRRIDFQSISADLDGSTLRELRVDDDELIRAIHGTVRSARWDTLEPATVSTELGDDGSVSIVSRYDGGEGAFEWSVDIGSSRESVRYRIRITALTDLAVARAGVCVLLPIELAGVFLSTRSLYGTRESRLPTRIAPDPIVTGVTGLAYVTATSRVEIEFEGDVFEMEDQRNWGDASFKLYAPSLDAPRPRLLRAGDLIERAVRVSVFPREEPSRGEAVPRRPFRVEPAVDDLPPVGFRHDADVPLRPDRVASLSPSHLHVVVDTDSQGWHQRAVRAFKLAAESEVPVQLDLVCGTPPRPSEVQSLFEVGDVAHCVPIDRAARLTTPRLFELVSTVAVRAGTSTLMGFGTWKSFAEINRARELVDDAQFVSFPICPQSHAIDPLSILQTPPVFAAAAQAATALGMPVRVGPVSFGSQRQVQSPSQVGAPGDRRARGVLGAVWSLMTIAHLAGQQVDGLSWFPLTGPEGILSEVDDSPAVEVWPIVCGADALVMSEHRHGLSRCTISSERGSVTAVVNLRRTTADVGVDIPASSAVRTFTIDGRATEAGVVDLGAVPPRTAYLAVHP